jgi:golgin subfamily B member 1
LQVSASEPTPSLVTPTEAPPDDLADESIAWWYAATSLEKEAHSSADTDARAMRLGAAAGIHRDRVGDWSRAEALYRAACDAGLEDPDVLRDLGDLVATREDFEGLAGILERRAVLLADPKAKAEAFQDAALVARNNMRNDAEAVRLLELAVEADQDDYFSLRLLRDMHLRLQRWESLPPVLTRMAELAPPALAAEYHVERGQVFESRLSDDDQARVAYFDARTADPAYGPAFLALERYLRRTEAWEDLAQLYAAEAQTDDGPDGRFWGLWAAHTYWLRCGDSDQAATCFAPLEAEGLQGSESLELRAFLDATERWEALAALLQQQAGQREGVAASVDLFAAGHLLELRLGQPDQALECYQKALEADAAATPAVEAACRLLAAKGDQQPAVALIEAVLSQVADPDQLVGLHFMLAELHEHTLGQPELARDHYLAVLEQVSSYLPALDGLARVQTRLGALDQLAALYEQRAILDGDPEVTARQLTLAGAVWNGPSTDIDKAIGFYRRALEAVPDHGFALDALNTLLRDAERWEDLAKILEAAARASRDGDDAVGLFYEAGRLWDMELGQSAAAVACYRGALELSPGFLPARIRLRSLLLADGDLTGAYGLIRAEADASEDPARKAWLLFHALLLSPAVADASSAEIIEDLALVAPDHPAAGELRVCKALGIGDRLAAAEALRQLAARGEDDAQTHPMWIHAGRLLAEQGDNVAALQALSMVLSGETCEGLPVASLARLCESLGYWDEATQALELADTPASARYLGRIKELYIQDPEAALASYRRAVESEPTDLVAWLGVERLLTSANDHAALAAVHASLVVNTEAPAIRGLHALLGAHLYEGIDDLDNARKLYEAAFEARAGRGKAFDGLLRVLVAQEDGAAIRDIFVLVDVDRGLELANALIDVGDLEGALGCVTDAVEGAEDPLPLLLHQERILAELGRWQEVFETLSERRKLSSDNDALAWIERDQRVLLAEHLAETDEAWNFYRALYEERPNDPEVLEALANISQARGETDLAIQYLEQRAQVAEDDTDRGRVYRLLATIQVKAENPDAAREAYLQALNIDPEDLEALDGLQALATQAKDWRTVVGILARKGVLFEGPDQIDTYATIARIWEDELQDIPVAIESWRKVLELDAEHLEALQRLVALTKESATWKAFVDHGQALSKLIEGEERSELLYRIGSTYEVHLNSLADAIRFLEAASSEPAPNADAARARERIHTERGEWEQVIKALLALADATDGEEQLESLLKAARIRTTTLHNRKAASEIYAKVLDVAPDNAEALRFQCDQLFEGEAYAEAVDLFERLEPIESERDLDDFDEQIEVAQYYFRFGETLRSLGRHADAVSRYEHTLELNDTHLPSLEALGPLYMEASEWKQCERVYRKLLQLTGGRGEPSFLAGIYTQLGHIQRHLGNLDKAKKRFNKALELRQNDVGALLGLAAVQYDRGEWNALLNVFNNVIFHARERAEVISAYLAKGYVLDRKLGLPDKAADHYRKSLNFDPDEPRALLLLGEISLHKQEWDEAARLFGQALGAENIGTGTRANLLLALAASKVGAGDTGSAPDLIDEASGIDVTLSDSLAPADPTSASDLIEVLAARIAPPGI